MTGVEFLAFVSVDVSSVVAEPSVDVDFSLVRVPFNQISATGSLEEGATEVPEGAVADVARGAGAVVVVASGVVDAVVAGAPVVSVLVDDAGVVSVVVESMVVSSEVVFAPSDPCAATSANASVSESVTINANGLVVPRIVRTPRDLRAGTVTVLLRI
jgi:hypothetical protein